MFLGIGASSGGAPIQGLHDCTVVPAHPSACATWMVQDSAVVWMRACMHPFIRERMHSHDVQD